MLHILCRYLSSKLNSVMFYDRIKIKKHKSRNLRILQRRCFTGQRTAEHLVRLGP
jgi:hypothetical protein